MEKIMRKIAILIATVAFFTPAINAQKIMGTVKDDQGKGLEKTTVTLLRAKDSSAVKFNATDKTGNYSFTTAGPGRYLVSVTHVGYKPSYSNAFEVAAGTDFTVPDMNLVKAEATLQGVSVSSKK